VAAPFVGFSKVGDLVVYPLTVENHGAIPLFIQSITDTLLGDVVVNHVLQVPGAAGVNPFVTGIFSSFNFSLSLAQGASITVFVARTVQATDSDPTPNTVTFIGTDDLPGLDMQISSSADDSVNLFQPSATLTVTASPTSGSVGTSITYTYALTNTSSADSPNLVLDLNNPNDSLADSLLGNLEADAIHAATGSSIATLATVAPGGTFSFTETRAIEAGDPNPLTNMADVAFTLAQNLGNFPNVIRAGGSASVTIQAP